MKLLLYILTGILLIGTGVIKHKQAQYTREFEACTDYTDNSCEVCELFLDGKEREIIKAYGSPESISVVFTQDGKEYALDYLTENEYLTLVKKSK